MMEKTNRPSLQAALLCEGVTTDAEGRHTIHNEFSQYTMGYSQSFTILTIWRGNEGTAEYSYNEKTEIVAPDGRVVAEGKNGPFKVADSTYRQVNSILLENVDFTNEGVYTFKIALTDATSGMDIVCSSYPIMVI
ncbi:MAG: hypothetical protein H6Q73_2516 [Firmicutes bacterium]|nr:hypothetical protein [Bacillota bacterium]